MSGFAARLKSVKPVWWLAAALCVCVLACLMPRADNSASNDIERALSQIQGAGSVRVAVHYTQETGGFGTNAQKTPQGAVIVAEGAHDTEVRLMLLRAAQTLLGLPLSRIDVFPMEGTQ